MSQIDVSSLVSQLMDVERQPLNLLTARQATFKKRADALDSLKTLVTDIGTKANAFDIASEWNLLKTSSSSSGVTTSVTSGGVSGSLAFTVGDVATSHKVYSGATLASTSASVTAASRLLVTAGGGALGIAQATGSNDLAVGAHTVEVTQASKAAVRTGPWPSSAVDFDDTTNALTVELNGTAYTVTLGNGVSLDRQAVVDRLNTAFQSADAGGGPTDISGQLKASVNANGEIQLATTGEGSAHSLQVTGGTALTPLGWTPDAAAVTGTDAKVKVDGVETVITDIRAGQHQVLASTTGTVDLTFAGGLRTGKLNARQVDLGDGSLSAVVNAINGSGGDLTASAIKVGEGAYRLQIQSKLSGEAGRMTSDLSVFTGAGGFSVLSTGTDASITLTGDNPITIKSSSNTFADVLPGVNFTVSAKSTDPVTVTATRDQDALASRIQAMVDSVNKTVADIKTKTAWDTTTGTGGALTGDYQMSRLQQTLRGAVTTTVATGGDLTQASQVGITLNKDGSLAFDKAKFQAAYAANPTAVQRVFVSAADDPNPGITQRLAAVVKQATDYTSGTLSTASKTQRDRVTNISKQLDRWEDRLAIRQQTLTTQFVNLNTALSNLGNQSQWLAGQISGLSTAY